MILHRYSSPDLAHSHYFCSRTYKKIDIRGRYFRSDEEVKATVKEWVITHYLIL